MILHFYNNTPFISYFFIYLPFIINNNLPNIENTLFLQIHTTNKNMYNYSLKEQENKDTIYKLQIENLKLQIELGKK